jgi:hypothetical protein
MTSTNVGLSLKENPVYDGEAPDETPDEFWFARLNELGLFCATSDMEALLGAIPRSAPAARHFATGFLAGRAMADLASG